MKYLTWLKNEEYIKSIKNHELNEDSELDENEGLIGVDERKLKIAIALVWLAEESETDEKRREIARRQAEIMRYRAILGWTEDDVAKFLGKSSETITKDYKKAKAKLLTFIEAAEGEAPAP
jgi:DNA-directed RNA polymerase specialized sigma24 family protein